MLADLLQLGKNWSDFSKRRRKVKIQIRMSPDGKGKAGQWPAPKRGTRTATSRQEFPQSTNVSSPVQAGSKRRTAQNKRTNAEPSIHSKSSIRDDAIISDYDPNNFDEPSETEDDSSDDVLGPIREAGKPQRSKKRQLGPPITIDEKLGKLNSTHRLVVEDFLFYADKASKDVGLSDITSWMYENRH